MALLDTLRKAMFGTRVEDVEAEVEAAVTLHEAGRLEEAGSAYRAILAKVRHPRAVHLLGLIAHQRGDNHVALGLMNEAVALDAETPLFHFNLGNVHAALGDANAAGVSFRRALKLKENYPAAWFNYGKALMQTGHAAEAVRPLRRARELDAALPGVGFELALALIAWADSGRDPAAADHYDEAIELLRRHWPQADQPVDARFQLAYALQRRGRLTRAAAEYAGILQARPDLWRAHNNLANCYNELGRIGEALAHYREALRLEPAQHDIASAIVSALNYDPDCAPAQVYSEHRDAGRRIGESAGAPRTSWRNDRDPERRLRIGYVSPDFRRHPVANLFRPVIERHDQTLYEAYCYYNFPSGDATTERIREHAAQWRDVCAMSDGSLAELIVSDRIDILVDLAGHTAGGRLGVLARKPAPVQVSWLGYFNTTGLDTVDYFVTDPWSSPAGQDGFFVEKLVRLPDTRFSYEPWDGWPAVNGLPALERGSLTFGSLNNLSKTNPAVLSAWAAILDRVAGSRLLVQTGGLSDPENAERFAALCERQGIARERLDLRPFALFTNDTTWREIDIALDPFPFCGGLTTMDALWMGVPVVTLQGALIAGRQSASVLHNLGMPELVAGTPQQYADTAVGLAGDLQALARLRGSLRERFSASPLHDHYRFTRALESAYRTMWGEWARR